MYLIKFLVFVNIVLSFPCICNINYYKTTKTLKTFADIINFLITSNLVIHSFD